jgi:signal transduction histidine kinase
VRLGLRARYVAVLAFVSALTLVVAAFALFSPLGHLLRNDALQNLSRTLTSERPTLERLSSGDVRPNSRRLLAHARSLRRRTGAEVGILAGDGKTTLVSTDPDPAESFAAATEAARTGRPQETITGQGAESEAQAATPVSIDGVRVIVAARRHLDDVQAANRVVARAFVVAAVAGLVGAVLAGLAIAGRTAGRVRRLRDSALRVAQVGPVAEFKPEGGRDEIGDLSRTFAVMQERLREQEQARRAFVATASHELRTPLSSLQVMLDMLIDDLEADPVAVEDALRQARSADEQAVRLSQLASELLDLSRIDAGVPLREEPVDVPEVLRSVVAELDLRLTTEGRSIDVVLDGREVDGAGWAVADPGSVARILRILLDNALRHGASGRVHAQMSRSDARVGIAVQDEGPGVSPQERERIFERFSRGTEATSAGFGLGLAIGRELARRMDGDLVLEDSPRGARFVLWLPGAPAP